MPSSAPVTPDTLVTLKVNFQGGTRRFKLPLREVGASSLEDKIRASLCIGHGAQATFERYSDSASSYVVLDHRNTTVWKQLYRAAKAKQKLKLRVTLSKCEEPTKGPKPVTVEDEPETDSSVRTQSKSETISAPSHPSEAAESTKPNPSEDSSSMVSTNLPNAKVKGLDHRLEKAMSQLHSRMENLEQTSSEVPAHPQAAQPGVPSTPVHDRKCTNFAVCCNCCDRTIPDSHYHCSTCEDGDFDLCHSCVEQGMTCYNPQHWLIKRFVRGDSILVSTTERIAPKPKLEEVKPASEDAGPALVEPEVVQQVEPTVVYEPPRIRFNVCSSRTCNSCVQELPDKEFLHCLSCEDYDLCQDCFRLDKHGHHPQHGFTAAVAEHPLPSDISKLLAPGRNQRHHAICDGCEKFIFGIRHKCLDCPDWDYCSECVVNHDSVHPNHRFIPIYEQLQDTKARTATRQVHYGVRCDGPLCKGTRQTYIVGERYKCTVCHDTDFCANCEAIPANDHNKTHPLVKFKTPVKSVEVTTKGKDMNGQRMPVMGDRILPPRKHMASQATATPPVSSVAISPVPAVVEVKSRVHDMESLLDKLRCLSVDSRSSTSSLNHADRLAAMSRQHREACQQAMLQAMLRWKKDSEIKTEEAIQSFESPTRPSASETLMGGPQELSDGKVVTPSDADKVVVQDDKTRIMKSPSETSDSNGDETNRLVAVFVRDTVNDGTLMPPSHSFEQTWVLRNAGDRQWPAGCSVKFVGGDYMGQIDPNRPARVHDLVSASESTVCYDSLAPGEEFSFTVNLRTPAREGKAISYWRLTTSGGHKFGHRLWCDVDVEMPKALEESDKAETKTETETRGSGQMIFPKLEKESPESSTHVDMSSETGEIIIDGDTDDFEDCALVDDWAMDEDDAFLTDEEYDILDASDEESLGEPQKRARGN